MKTTDSVSSNSLSPPHLLLPPEILVDIFTFTCTMDLEVEPSQRRTSPLTLGQVCGAWRAFAWSIPSLWGIIDLALSTTKYYAQLELLKAWLGRAQNTPLEIYLISPTQLDDYWASNPPHEIIRLLATHSSHWLSIDLSIPKRCYDDLAQVKGNLPLLASASIRHPYLGRITRRLDVFETCPLLREIKVSQYYLADVSLPWNQLTHCTVDALFVDECHTLLVTCPNVIFCRFICILRDSDGERPHIAGTITLPKLRTLEIIRTSGREITELLNSIVCPSLRRLQLDISVLMESLHVEKTIRTWGCSLESLSVQNAFITEDELLDCLRTLPSLQQLHMAEPFISDDLSNDFVFISSLTNSHEFLPILRELKYEGLIGFDGTDIFDMVKMRWKMNIPPGSGRVRLGSVTITSPDYYSMDEEQQKELDDMRKEGLKCSLNDDNF